MRIAQFAVKESGALGIGIVRDDGILDFTEAQRIYSRVLGHGEMRRLATVLQMLEAGLCDVEYVTNVVDFVETHRHAEQCVRDPETLKVLAPVLRPPKIIALGLNYATHAEESGYELPAEPVLFAKAPTSVIGPDEPVVYKGFLTRVDPEVELAVVIGRGGANIAEERADAHIAGYTIVNDVTARDMQAADMEARHPWFRSKSLDTFCPMGPWLVTPDEMPDPLEVDVELRVGNEVRQKDNTRSLIFGVPRLVREISKLMRLEPGDVISTGTPFGMKPVVPGDVMTCTVEGIGTLSNPVVAEKRKRPAT